MGARRPRQSGRSPGRRSRTPWARARPRPAAPGRWWDPAAGGGVCGSEGSAHVPQGDAGPITNPRFSAGLPFAARAIRRGEPGRDCPRDTGLGRAPNPGEQGTGATRCAGSGTAAPRSPGAGYGAVNTLVRVNRCAVIPKLPLAAERARLGSPASGAAFAPHGEALGSAAMRPAHGPAAWLRRGAEGQVSAWSWCRVKRTEPLTMFLFKNKPQSQ